MKKNDRDFLETRLQEFKDNEEKLLKLVRQQLKLFQKVSNDIFEILKEIKKDQKGRRMSKHEFVTSMMPFLESKFPVIFHLLEHQADYVQKNSKEIWAFWDNLHGILNDLKEEGGEVELIMSDEEATS